MTQDNEQPLSIAEGLSKSYRCVLGCCDVSFSLYQGEVRAIVGKSDFGKSTLPQMLSTQIELTATLT